ncbi:Abi family protein [bacterium]|nr:Abi family protein [bacterium]
MDGIKEQNLKFIDSFQFKDLKELFNFDKTLKSITNDLLQETEKRLTSGIIYHTLKSLYSICKNIINLPFLLLDDY